MTTQEKIAVMQHWLYGGKVEVQYWGRGDWTMLTSTNPSWEWRKDGMNYRIYKEPKQKQTVTIEKWLLKYSDIEDDNLELYITEGTKEYFRHLNKVKLLNTYEVEL